MAKNRGLTLIPAPGIFLGIIYSCARWPQALRALCVYPLYIWWRDMARLKLLKDGTHRMPPMLGYLAQGAREHDRARKAANPLRALYGTARWQRLRWQVLARDLFTCRRCGKVETDTSQLVADHVQPHRGSLDLFWDAGNLQCLCKPCHDRAKQRDEYQSRRP